MPERSTRYAEAHENAADGELPYISKSRVKQYVNNPEHFRLKYLEGYSVEETGAMRRGSDIHEVFEEYYKQAQGWPETVADDPAIALPDNYMTWADYVEPYISNFLRWERERLETAGNIDEWVPIAIEEELWRDEVDPSWTGLADAVLPAASIGEVPVEEGIVIVDFKTGSVPKEKYRNEGIYLELVYYEMLFEGEYDVAGSVAYYPREHEVVAAPERDSVKNRALRTDINAAVADMVERTAEYEGEHFETNPGPLCKWGLDDDEESSYYGICPCKWGVPANNPDVFKELVGEDKNVYEIAEVMDTTTDAVAYWKYKMDL